MPKIFLLFVLAAFLCACDAGQGDADATEQASTDTASDERPARKSKSREPRWEITVDGRPTLSGRVITAVTVGAYGNYAMASSETIINIRLVEDNPNAPMNIKYNVDEILCSNFGDATVTVEGERAVISGEVGCYPPGEDADNHTKASIDGWFELKN